MSASPELHPVISQAYLYADAHVNKDLDTASQATSWRCAKDDFLFIAGRGIFQLILEIEKSGVAVPYELNEAYALLLLIEKNISGYMGNLKSAIVSPGYAESQAHAELVFALARLSIEQRNNHTQESEKKPLKMLGIVGGISSGKGTVGEIITNKVGSNHYALSDRLRELSLSLGGDATFPREKLRDVNDLMKPTYGKAVFVRWTKDIAQRQAASKNHDFTSLDGFRSVEEAQVFKDERGILIGVRTSKETRFKRLVERGRVGDDGWEAFEESDKKESLWIDPIFEICDYIIENEGNREDLEKNVEMILEKVRGGRITDQQMLQAEIPKFSSVASVPDPIYFASQFLIRQRIELMK